jgi:hypothetical protein
MTQPINFRPSRVQPLGGASEEVLKFVCFRLELENSHFLCTPTKKPRKTLILEPPTPRVSDAHHRSVGG